MTSKNWSVKTDPGKNHQWMLKTSISQKSFEEHLSLKESLIHVTGYLQRGIWWSEKNTIWYSYKKEYFDSNYENTLDKSKGFSTKLLCTLPKCWCNKWSWCPQHTHKRI